MTTITIPGKTMNAYSGGGSWTGGYLYPDDTTNLETTSYTGSNTVTISKGISIFWVSTFTLDSQIVVDDSGGTMPVFINNLTKYGPGPTRDLTIGIKSSDTSVGIYSSSVGVYGNFAESTFSGIVPPVSAQYDVAFQGSNFTLPAGSTITFWILNSTTGAGDRQIIFEPNGSYANIPVV